MSSISSIDTSIYSGLIENISSYIPARNALDNKVPAVTREDTSAVDLSSYYSNIRPEDLIATAGNNVARSAEELDNAMVSALQNGYSINDVCNIKKAQAAYAANCAIFKVANEISTFELKI